MAGFEKVKLATGEFRSDYIRRRLGEGGTVQQITDEINAPGHYSGPEGKQWGASVVYSEKRKLEARPVSIAAPPVSGRTAPVESEESAEVPAEYEGILDEEDVRQVRVEAQEALRKKQRDQAKKELLAKATQELEREARLAADRGAARGDLVDVTIDLAPYAPDIRLDGRQYLHGMTYRVPRKVAAVLNEQISRSWLHQEGLAGKENSFLRPRQARISMKTGAVYGAQGLPV